MSEAKGHALEIAVHAIETVILQSSPSLCGQPFEIERRRVVTVGGVRHEIDVFAKVGAAKGYESVFIFECKNWEAPVGKNELIIFSEKIDATVAQRGYFVARLLTKDALSQAAKDPRITILYATEHDPTNIPPPNSFHIAAQVPTPKASLTFRPEGFEGTECESIMIANDAVMHLRGGAVPLSEYVSLWLKELFDRRLLKFHTNHLAEGIHPMAANDERFFDVGECVIDGQPMEHARIEAEFGVQIIRPAVISDYEVSTRGRVLRLATSSVGDYRIDTAFVVTARD